MSISRPVRWLALAVGVVGLAVAFVLLARQQGARVDPDQVEPNAVDIGFARDMSIHHAQAVQMASYTQDHAPTPDVRALASTIALQQQLEIGEMLGWLEAWAVPRASNGPAMAWMKEHHSMPGMTMSAPMPGMATPAELDALLNLQGRDLEVRFLQLMIRHHQGGLPMAKAAARGASQAYVRGFAGQMVLAQAEEVDRMRQMLQARGGSTLPAP